MSKETYRKRKEQGICVLCGKIPPVDGRVMCAGCLEKSKEKTEENRIFLKKLGICPRCGRNNIIGQEKECLECSAKRYAKNRKSAEKRNEKAKEYYSVKNCGAKRKWYLPQLQKSKSSRRKNILRNLSCEKTRTISKRQNEKWKRYHR